MLINEQSISERADLSSCQRFYRILFKFHSNHRSDIIGPLSLALTYTDSAIIINVGLYIHIHIEHRPVFARKHSKYITHYFVHSNNLYPIFSVIPNIIILPLYAIAVFRSGASPRSGLGVDMSTPLLSAVVAEIHADPVVFTGRGRGRRSVTFGACPFQSVYLYIQSSPI